MTNCVYMCVCVCVYVWRGGGVICSETDVVFRVYVYESLSLEMFFYKGAILGLETRK